MNTNNITWELGDIVEVLKGNWAMYELTGTDEEGNEYIADCQTFMSDPQIENVDNIELDNHSL